MFIMIFVMKRRSVMARRVFAFLPVFVLLFFFTSNVFALELTPAQIAEINDRDRKSVV